MQAPKARTTSLEVPQRTSPAAPRTGRKLKTAGGSNSDSVSSPNPTSRTPKNRNLKVNDRRSPQSSAAEKKCPSKVSELETQLVQLQEELKKAREQLSSSESLKKRAQHEAEETKKQLAAMSEKLEESQKQLLELSDSEEARLQELRKISQDRDRAWQSELEAVQKQHELDSAALASAMSEIQKLKIQLDRAAGSEAAQARHAESAHGEIQHLRIELTETLALVEDLKAQLNDSKESEAEALQELNKARMQLEVARLTEETLRADVVKAKEACKSMALELEQSKNQVCSLEELVDKLRPGPVSACEDGDIAEANNLETEIDNLKAEVSQLRAALEGSERRYQEEYIQSTLQIRSAYELVERTKSESFQRETQLEAKLKATKADIEALKEKLMQKEATLQSISDENKELSMRRESELEAELKKSELVLADLKACLLDKETELQCITEENDMLKSEIRERDTKTRIRDEALVLAEVAITAAQESQMDADKNSTKATPIDEQLNAAQAANSELEAELRRLKVQSNQWRKAAEAAAAMLSTGNNGKYSLDYHTLGGKLGSPLSDDVEDDSPKKKNGNMLKKIGVLLKKSQK